MAVLSHLVNRLARVALLLAVVSAMPARALPPEHEMRRLMLAAEEAVNAGNWGEAGEFLNRLQQLEGDKPVDYYFYRGQVMFQAGHLNEAQAALETYVTRAGAEGSHYPKALALITDVERARKAGAAKGAVAAAGQPAKIAVIEPAGDQELAKLRQLYLTDNDREALVLHLNSLLELAGWRVDQAVVRLDRPADISYQVSVSGGVLQIQELRRDPGNRLVRQSEPLEVYGVNPMVEWSCEPTASACWIYDPRDGTRLMQLGHDRRRTEEIAQTLGQLIRNLQSPSGS
ncbi:hypothetical protein BTO32_09160 [Marinobacter lutaoensis]|jgi:hypothetical protein|uniref:Uncharacterized protein n=1 Tax=Marinobacter lutaoensis TaxID=135739 RepID=A0A1V2DTN0_9GAMM|nr:hypothetical protein [Marinobacter lutaoensis]ONF43810.1 hypothetical protein BTO32_09160 [Marinobacter lutaoensis]